MNNWPWLISIQISLELLTVVAHGSVLLPIGGNFSRGDRNRGRVTGTSLVGHHQHQVCVGNQFDGEGSLAVALVAVSKNSLQWPFQMKCRLVQLVEVSFLVTRHWLGLIDVFVLILGSRQGPGPIWVPEVMNFHPDDCVFKDMD